LPVWLFVVGGSLVGLAGLALAGWALFWDRPRGRPRCPKCWYLMIGAPSLRCPECGQAVVDERQFYRVRRRYRWASLGLTLALAPLATGVATWIRHEGWKALLSKWITVSQTKVAGYTVQILADRAGLPEQRLRILRGRDLCYQLDGCRLELGGQGDSAASQPTPPPGIGQDVTGAGLPDLIVCEDSGGAHCCLTFHILELGPNVQPLATIHAQDGGRFEDVDHDGLPEFVGADWTFAYWHECFADSPAPRIILRYKDGRYVLAADLMCKPAPSAAELADLAVRVSAAKNPNARDEPTSDLWREMLELIYTGHEPLAWDFAEAAWPPGLPDQARFLAEFRKHLAQSPYWPDVRALSLP
jgi:hypothetical protein